MLTMDYQVEQVISELAKIDNATESILTSTDVDKTNYANEIETKTIEFDKQLNEKVNKELSDFKDSISNDNNRILKQMRSNTEKDLEKLEEAFNSNHTKMAKDIFATLIKE